MIGLNPPTEVDCVAVIHCMDLDFQERTKTNCMSLTRLPLREKFWVQANNAHHILLTEKQSYVYM